MTQGIAVGTTPWSWGELGSADGLCAQAEAAEAMGFHSFWLPENHFGEHAAVPSPLLLLAAVAARTRRIKLGTTSYLLPIRPPLLASEDVAVLDRLSEGRLILGLGRGIGSAMFTAFGVAPSEKRSLFSENLALMRKAWRGDVIAEGDDGAPITLAPLPLQQPSPPIWVAAFGPLALKQVAQLGLPYLASPIETLDMLEANYRAYRQHLVDASLPPVDTVPVMRSVFVAEDRRLVERVCEALDKAVPRSLRKEDIPLQDWAIVGDTQYVQDKLREYTERLGLTHLILRAGISGVDEAQQMGSHRKVLHIVGDL